ncbi:MAG: peptidase [Lentisphaerae bacterium GWF2_44_16]|nr:MAG: peptidase [Lentisphaerae bacterium GWF2_44_16]HAU65880.1 peptidase [Candidatus Uhrbacteria bacterium]
MKKIIVNENQRGLLFRSGRFVKLLEPGAYVPWFGAHAELLTLDRTLMSPICGLDVLLADPGIAAATTVVEVADGTLALHFVNNLFVEALRPGRYAFWTVYDRHTFRSLDVKTPEVPEDLPLHVLAKMNPLLFAKVVVANHQCGRLYFDGKFVRLLDPGTHWFWQGTPNVTYDLVDARLTQMNVTGQEILTRDKVSLRINLVCMYRITDFVKVASEINDFEEQMRVAVQLSLREYIGKYPIDEILENKDQISAHVLTRLKDREKDFFVEIVDAGVKDIILPGEIRDIMNTVLVAEKRAQANVVTRREEVASTRSLLNTAKLMEENQTLYKLKELEYLEKICEHVGNINLTGSGDLMSQIANIIKSGK